MKLENAAFDPRRPLFGRSRRSAGRLVRRSLLPSIAIMLAVTGGVSGADFDEEDPESPQEVLRNRRLEGIFDRVTIELAHAGGNLAGAQIDVEVAPGGAVTLLGVVASEAASDRAAELAAMQVGVKSVQNRLNIDPTRVPTPASSQAKIGPGESAPPGSASPASDGGAAARADADAELSRVVASVLAEELPFEARAERAEARGWHVDGQGWRFDVVARDGNVRLVGDVESVDAVARAVDRVKDRPDVAGVELELEPADEGGFFDWLGF